VAKGKKTGGRQSTLTPGVHKAIVAHVRNGTPQKYAATAAGIPEGTFKKWLSRGIRESRGIYRDLWAALKEARGGFVASNVGVIKKAANGVMETTVKETTIQDRLGRPVLVTDADGRPILDNAGRPTVATRRETTTRKVFEWTAAAWLLERQAQEEFGANRLEVKELRKQLAAVTAQLERLADGQQRGTDPPGEAGGQAGGTAQPDRPAGG